MNLRDVTNSFQHVVSTTFEATTTAHKLKQVVVDMETGQRGFIITGIDNYLEPYNLAENKFDKLLKQLRKNLAHRADYLDTLEEIEHLKYQWIGAAGVPEIEARRLISQTTTNRQAIESMILSGKGKKLFDKIRTLLSAISNDFKMVGKKDELQLITQISKDIVDSETGQRGFLLAGRDWFLEPYYAGQVGFTKNIKELEEMLGADSTTQKKLSEIEKLYKEWLTEIAWPEIQSRIEYEKNPRSLGDLAKLMATGTGKAIIDKLREQLDTFISKLTKEIEQVSEQAEQETQFNNLVGLIVSCAGIVLTVFLSFSLGRSIITPIRELTDGTNRIGNGDLDHKINVTSKDELGFLAQSFNKMTAELEMTTVSRDYFDNIIRSMTDSLIIISPDGNIKKVNIACSTLLGCEEKELLGQPIDYIFHDEISKSTLIPELVKKEAITNIETNYRTKNGIIIPMAFSAAAMRDKNGKLLAIVTVARNITEKKRLEKELLEKQSQLAHADRLTALGEMATGIAHEINQPLNIISLATQVIKRFFSRHHCDSLTSEAVEEIQLQVGRAATIINNIRTLYFREVRVTPKSFSNHSHPQVHR